MKLPRWLVIAMLTTSVLSVLAAAGCWWVTWPERTAREYFDLVVDKRFDEAAQMTPMKAARPDLHSIGEPRFVPLPSSLIDACRGRRQFEIQGEKTKIVVTVEKGKITELVSWTDIRDKLPLW